MKGRPQNSTINSATPLRWAARARHKDVAELLILKGANVNAADNTGANPWHLADQAGQQEVVDLLIKYGGHK